ncbi:hypothetical protein [Pseudodonghicola flavimaris]|uniref:Uncharacterized protein n=1 Tax=Pseudodonghicola flavimaris TaxID=3050036 RepID=A0ABT7EWL3_9RHOB|nr:hypothetical protein [Pseudodonghicola flavimaris]MDK3016733.1 hypothetical protein [Pseudodonghicola flavimaris]
MSDKKTSSAGRAAALAAADRVRLLLEVVEDDAFLTEVLHSADRTMDGLRGNAGPGGCPGRGAPDPDTRARRASWMLRGRSGGRG